MTVAMITANEENTNLQSQSPIFSRIPAEIRNQVFLLALAADDDTEKPYSPYSYHYRPGYHYPHKIHLDLLLTCRRVYLETRFLSLSINEHTDWFFRAPPGTREKFLPKLNTKPKDDQRAYQNCLNEYQKSALCKVHIFTQQFWLEDAWPNHPAWPLFTQLWGNLTEIKITIRHTDWWNWEYGAPLAMDAKRAGQAKPNDWIEASNSFKPGSWGDAFRNFRALKVFQLELETVEGKKNELDKIIAHAETWQFVLGNGNVMAMDKSKTRKAGWVGSKYFIGKLESNPLNRRFRRLSISRNQIASHSDFITFHRNSSQEIPRKVIFLPAENPARTRLIATGVVFDDSIEAEASLTPEERLTYYVVTLTWHALTRPVDVT